MDGIKANGVILFLTRLPNRKGISFCFEDEGVLYPVAYVSEKLNPKAVELWDKLTKGLSYNQID